jgi:predicted nucleic acid-binding protein
VQFVDTNVLLHAISTVPEDAGKSRRANELLDRRDVGRSVQVLQEFYVHATRATRQDRISHDLAVRLVESFLRFDVQPLTIAVTLAALDTCERSHISYWDASIVEAVRALGCDMVLSEDLNDGQDFDGLVVRNPFESDG